MQGSTSQFFPHLTLGSTQIVLFLIDLFGKNSMPPFTTNNPFQTTIPQQEVNQATPSFQGPMIGSTSQVPQSFMQQEPSQQVYP